MDGEDVVERLSGVVAETLDAESDSRELARRAYRSRTQFFRVFRALIDETPGAMRRRLLLERAAWHLSRTTRSVTEIALDAAYGSLEAFTRAFRKAFGVSPSLYRRMGVTHVYLHSPNGIHLLKPAPMSEGAIKHMDLFELFSGQESFHTRKLLETAKTMTDEQLDRPLEIKSTVFPWQGPDQSVRQALDRLVQTKELWTAALTGGTLPPIDNGPAEDRTPEAMIRRLERTDAAFHKVLADVHDRAAWGDTFVDALCEPPETFTFGGMFAHVITFNAHRRMLAMEAMRGLGAKVEGFGCPTEYVTSLVHA